MKPFNFERALLGDPVVTRDGREVIELIFLKDPRNKSRMTGTVAEHGTSHLTHYVWERTGQLCGNGLANALDLCMRADENTYERDKEDGYKFAAYRLLNDHGQCLNSWLATITKQQNAPEGLSATDQGVLQALKDFQALSLDKR